MFKKSFYLAVFGLMLYLPGLVMAQQGRDFASMLELVKGNILNPIIGIIMAIALVYFLLGVLKYVQAGKDGNTEEARNMMLWGIIALFVMTAVWGLVQVVARTFQLDNTPIAPPVIESNLGPGF